MIRCYSRAGKANSDKYVFMYVQCDAKAKNVCVCVHNAKY